jgi:hypothetical protein
VCQAVRKHPNQSPDRRGGVAAHTRNPSLTVGALIGVRLLAKALRGGRGYSWRSACNGSMADTPTGQAFGDITAVPTMFLFDSTGKTVRVVYGAPPDLHHEVGKLLDGLLK